MANSFINEESIKLIRSRLPVLECPMCHNRKFELIDGLFFNALQQDANTLQLGGPSIPAVVLMCENCGMLSQHSAIKLGILPPNSPTGNEEDK